MSNQNRSPQNQSKENEYFYEKTQRNPNRNLFQKQTDGQNPQNVLNPSGQMFSQTNNAAIINQKQGSLNSRLQTNTQNQLKPSSVISGRKIFSQNDKASITSQQTNKQQNQTRGNQQMIQQQGNQNLDYQQSNMQNNTRRLSHQHDNYQQQNNNQNERNQFYQPQQNNSQQMYQELLEQFNQLQEAKQAAEQTHNLEIEDTKKHYEYKMSESQKKIQELVVKLQNQQQNYLQIQNQLKSLQEDVSNKDEELRHVLSQKEQTNIQQEDMLKLQEQKIQLEKVISDGKLYIEKIKLENELKSQEILKFKEEFKLYQIKLNQQTQQIESTNNNCQTMHSEIQQLIASNLDLQKKVEFERKDKEQKISDYQRILNRVNQNNTIKQSEDEKERRLIDLENNLKNMIEKNNQVNNDIKQKQAQIEKLQTLLKQNGINSQLGNNTPLENEKLKKYYGLSQIAEEQDEESFLEKSRNLRNDLNSYNVEELRSQSKCLLEDIESLKSQLNATKQKNILLSNENDQLRATSQLSTQNPGMINGSSATFIERIKELNNTISSLERDKENLIYENTVIVSQMKKEKQNREDEVKIYQNQIKNLQKIQSTSTTLSAESTSQFTAPSPSFSVTSKPSNVPVSQFSGYIQPYSESNTKQSLPQFVEQLTNSNPSLQQNGHVLSQIQQQPFSILSQPSKSASQVSTLFAKPPTGLAKQNSLQNQSTVSSIMSNQTSESLLGPNITQRLDKNSGLLTQNQSTTFRRTTSHDCLTSLNQQNPISNVGIQQISTSFIPHKFEQKDENQFYSHSNKGIMDQVSSFDNERKFSLTKDSYQQSSAIPYSKNLTEINGKGVNSSTFGIPQNASYVIVRPGEYIPANQQNTTSNLLSGDVNSVYQLQPKQTQLNPTQMSFGQFGDILQRAHISDTQEHAYSKQADLNLNTGNKTPVLTSTDTYNYKNPYAI